MGGSSPAAVCSICAKQWVQDDSDVTCGAEGPS